MKIEYRNEDYKNKNIYKVGNVIENDGIAYLVCHGRGGYFLINLYSATMVSGMYESLTELAQAAGNEYDRLVEAKVVVDYKADGGTEDEDTK